VVPGKRIARPHRGSGVGWWRGGDGLRARGCGVGLVVRGGGEGVALGVYIARQVGRRGRAVVAGDGRIKWTDFARDAYTTPSSG
jgi:hypothetical protein